MPLTQIPDSCSVAQFLFNEETEDGKSSFPKRAPWIIDSVSGEAFTRENLQCRTQCLAEAMVKKYRIGAEAVVSIISGNRVDYLTSFWAAHLVGASVFVTNPGFSVQELVPQFVATRPALFIVQPESFLTVREACLSAGLGHEHIVIIDSPSEQIRASMNAYELKLPPTIQDLVDFGAQDTTVPFQEFQLKSGEGRSRTAILFPSSGTTGAPKLILVSHYAFIANILQAAAHDKSGCGPRRYNPGEVSCAVLPFFHILGLLINVHHPILSGMSVVIVPKFNFPNYIETIEKHRVTHLLIVPPIITLFLKNHYRPSSLASVRVVSIAGAPLSELVLKFAEIVPQAAVGQIYGMTEAGALTGPTPGAVIPASHNNSGVVTYSVGKLLPGVIWRVVKTDGSQALQGETGELWVQTPSTALGYAEYRSEDETFGSNGWLQTGDEVFFNENDELFVVQRIKDFMKVKGFRVNPTEIEARLLQHPDVAECCVVPVPHEFCGQIPKAFVVLSSTIKSQLSSEQEESQIREMLFQHASLNMISYKHLIGGIEFCDSIPQTASGKFIRRLLKSI